MSEKETVLSWITSRTVQQDEQKAVRETELKTTLCANGSLEPQTVRSALEALMDEEQIQVGDGWIVPVVDKEYHRDAIGYVVENSTGDITEFVSIANKAIQDHWES